MENFFFQKLKKDVCVCFDVVELVGPRAVKHTARFINVVVVVVAMQDFN